MEKRVSFVTILNMNTAIVSLKKQLRKDMASRLEKLSTNDLVKQCKISNIRTWTNVWLIYE